MWVESASKADCTVQGPLTRFGKLLKNVRPHLVRPLRGFLKTENKNLHSFAFLHSRLVNSINTSEFDIVNIHWINGGMLSVSDISRIEKPLVWTVHDMWPFCGGEHYTEDLRWREGYRRDNRPPHESGLDLNRWTWRRKLKHWKRPVNIVTPSHWLGDCVRASCLMRSWPVSVIHYPIDTEKWKPIDRELARELLGLPRDVCLVLFGAIGGGEDSRKGFDLLQSALGHLEGSKMALELLVFGESRPKDPPNLGFPIHYAGHLYDDLSLRALYSAADVFVLPSRQDNLPNTGVEALACGTPIVAFDICGLPDLVKHKEIGWLAKPFDTADMACGIKWVLEDHQRLNRMRKLARETAVSKFSNSVISEKYLALYRDTMFL